MRRIGAGVATQNWPCQTSSTTPDRCATSVRGSARTPWRGYDGWSARPPPARSPSPWLAETRAAWTDPRGRHVRAYTGTFRIPPQARPMRRALLLDRAAHPDPPPALIAGPDGTLLRARRIAHRVRAGADLAGLRRPGAARAHEKRYTPETFATSFTGAVSIYSVTGPTPSGP